jgi:hypothetical protein
MGKSNRQKPKDPIIIPKTMNPKYQIKFLTI